MPGWKPRPALPAAAWRVAMATRPSHVSWTVAGGPGETLRIGSVPRIRPGQRLWPAKAHLYERSRYRGVYPHASGRRYASRAAPALDTPLLLGHVERPLVHGRTADGLCADCKSGPALGPAQPEPGNGWQLRSPLPLTSGAVRLVCTLAVLAAPALLTGSAVQHPPYCVAAGANNGWSVMSSFSAT